jgi:hypothetical protein
MAREWQLDAAPERSTLHRALASVRASGEPASPAASLHQAIERAASLAFARAANTLAPAPPVLPVAGPRGLSADVFTDDEAPTGALWSTRSLAPPLTRHDVLTLDAFAGVELEGVWPLLERCPQRLLSRGECLVVPGDEAHPLYLVLEGTLAEHADGPHSPPELSYPSGGAVGGLALLTGARATRWLSATARARVLVVDRPSFWQLVQASHAFALNALTLCAESAQRRAVRRAG